MNKYVFKIAPLAVMALLGNSVLANDTTISGFKQLKLLLGEWRGKLPDGNFIDISYHEINGGAIVERYHSKEPMWWNMSSVYHMDVDKIIMSHYCSWGNHPRMTAQTTDNQITDNLATDNRKTDARKTENQVKQLRFLFADMTITQPDNGHMRDLTFDFQDRDHFTHRWIWREDGKDTPLLLTMERKSSQNRPLKPITKAGTKTINQDQ